MKSTVLRFVKIAILLAAVVVLIPTTMLYLGGLSISIIGFFSSNKAFITIIMEILLILYTSPYHIYKTVLKAKNI